MLEQHGLLEVMYLFSFSHVTSKAQILPSTSKTLGDKSGVYSSKSKW
jgi:hypothetical protein